MHIDAAVRLEAASCGAGTPVATLDARVARLAYRALIAEVELTPKPGLVDTRNSGAHRDMDLGTFHASAAALAPWFQEFSLCGLHKCELPAEQFLPRLRPAGLACERAMFEATGGVNTHKGSIFALGLLCAAAGRLAGRGLAPESDSLCDEVAAICSGIVERELATTREAQTAGELFFKLYGLAGARGEAASGFATVRRWSLPAYERERAQGLSEASALQAALLVLLAHNPDTNLVARGGLAGMAYVQHRARELIAAGGIRAQAFEQRMIAFDDALVARWLSPGGSADLLAVTWFLAHVGGAGIPAAPAAARDGRDREYEKQPLC